MPEPALTRLFATHEEAVNDYISFRRDMEGLAIERACIYGSDTDLKVVRTIFERMEAAHQKRDPTEEAQLDAEFHMAIVEASHNVVLLHVMRSLFSLLQEAFIKVFRQIGTFRGDSRLVYWIKRIVINTALNSQRSKLYLYPMVDVEDLRENKSENISAAIISVRTNLLIIFYLVLIY